LEAVAIKAYEVNKGTAVEVQEAQRKTRLARERRMNAQYDIQAAFAEYDGACADIAVKLEPEETERAPQKRKPKPTPASPKEPEENP
jgi:outer membrane protein TolC